MERKGNMMTSIESQSREGQANVGNVQRYASRKRSTTDCKSSNIEIEKNVIIPRRHTTIDRPHPLVIPYPILPDENSSSSSSSNGAGFAPDSISPSAAAAAIAGSLQNQQQMQQQQQQQKRHTLPPKVDYVSILCGLCAGVAQAGLFNPFDRALYLSVKNNIPFLRRENFQNPYLGFFQSVGHRALSGGMYFPLEQFFMTVFVVVDDDNNGGGNTGALSNFLAGTAAGSMNAILVNPISAVKYKSWGRSENRGMMNEAIEMIRKSGGLRPFYNGLYPTICRDLVFGGCYTFLRFELQYMMQTTTTTTTSFDSENDETVQNVQHYPWAANFVAAALATVVSGPFNLARNMQYATKSRNVADSIGVVLQNFVQETKNQPTLYQKCRHVQNRLRIGWGTARVAVGMSFGHYTYDQLHGLYEQFKEDRQQQKQQKLARTNAR